MAATVPIDVHVRAHLYYCPTGETEWKPWPGTEQRVRELEAEVSEYDRRVRDLRDQLIKVRGQLATVQSEFNAYKTVLKAAVEG